MGLGNGLPISVVLASSFVYNAVLPCHPLSSACIIRPIPPILLSVYSYVVFRFSYFSRVCCRLSLLAGCSSKCALFFSDLCVRCFIHVFASCFRCHLGAFFRWFLTFRVCCHRVFSRRVTFPQPTHVRFRQGVQPRSGCRLGAWSAVWHAIYLQCVLEIEHASRWYLLKISKGSSRADRERHDVESERTSESENAIKVFLCFFVSFFIDAVAYQKVTVKNKAVLQRPESKFCGSVKSSGEEKQLKLFFQIGRSDSATGLLVVTEVWWILLVCPFSLQNITGCPVSVFWGIHDENVGKFCKWDELIGVQRLICPVGHFCTP